MGSSGLTVLAHSSLLPNNQVSKKGGGGWCFEMLLLIGLIAIFGRLVDFGCREWASWLINSFPPICVFFRSLS